MIEVCFLVKLWLDKPQALVVDKGSCKEMRAKGRMFQFMADGIEKNIKYDVVQYNADKVISKDK
jgi:hypothetical protein